MRIHLFLALFVATCNLNAHADSAALYLENKPRKALRSAATFTASEFDVNAFAREHGLAVSGFEYRVVAQSEDLGLTTVRATQSFNGFPVYGSSLLVNFSPDGDVRSTIATFTRKTPSSTAATLSKEEVQLRAKELVSGGLSIDLFRASDPNLMVFDPSLIGTAQSREPVVAYVLTVSDTSGEISEEIIIDAASGALLQRTERVRHALNRRIYDCSFGDGQCYLDAAPRTTPFVFGRSEGQPARGPNRNFPTFQTDVDFAYDYVGKIYEYFKSTFNREGANGVGGIGVGELAPFTSVGTYAEYGIYSSLGVRGCPNAFYSPPNDDGTEGGFMTFCNGLVSPDIVGHEYTHAVIHFSVRDNLGRPAGFIYRGESGSLEEGLADVFGEAGEALTLGGTDWILGTLSNNAITRNVKNPESARFPASFYSANVSCGAGVHQNSTIISHIAHLLAAGGSNNGCSINPIGPAKQQALFYRALNSYLSPASRFSDAYSALLFSCFDLYGKDSPECFEVIKAANASQMNQGGRCSSIAAVPPDCDACPLNRQKAAPGVCGCDKPDLDNNRNGIIDCIDPDANTIPTPTAPDITSITPPAPTLRAGRGSVTISAALPDSGRRALVSVTIPRHKRGRKTVAARVLSRELTAATTVIRNLPSNVTVTVSLTYFEEGAVRRSSLPSAARRIRIR